MLKSHLITQSLPMALPHARIRERRNQRHVRLELRDFRLDFAADLQEIVVLFQHRALECFCHRAFGRSDVLKNKETCRLDRTGGVDVRQSTGLTIIRFCSRIQSFPLYFSAELVGDFPCSVSYIGSRVSSPRTDNSLQPLSMPVPKLAGDRKVKRM